MEYETFLNEVKEQMEHALGKGYDLTLRRVPKNNGLMLDGLCIAKSGGHVAPAIYLNPCYLQHQAGRPGQFHIACNSQKFPTPGRA